MLKTLILAVVCVGLAAAVLPRDVENELKETIKVYGENRVRKALLRMRSVKSPMTGGVEWLRNPNYYKVEIAAKERARAAMLNERSRVLSANGLELRTGGWLSAAAPNWNEPNLAATLKSKLGNFATQVTPESLKKAANAESPGEICDIMKDAGFSVDTAINIVNGVVGNALLIVETIVFAPVLWVKDAAFNLVTSPGATLKDAGVAIIGGLDGGLSALGGFFSSPFTSSPPIPATPSTPAVPQGMEGLDVFMMPVMSFLSPGAPQPANDICLKSKSPLIDNTPATMVCTAPSTEFKSETGLRGCYAPCPTGKSPIGQTLSCGPASCAKTVSVGHCALVSEHAAKGSSSQIVSRTPTQPSCGGKPGPFGGCYAPCPNNGPRFGPFCLPSVKSCAGKFPTSCGPYCAVNNDACKAHVLRVAEAAVMSSVKLTGIIATAGALVAQDVSQAAMLTAASMTLRLAFVQAIAHVVARGAKSEAEANEGVLDYAASYCQVVIKKEANKKCATTDKASCCGMRAKMDGMLKASLADAVIDAAIEFAKGMESLDPSGLGKLAGGVIKPTC